MENVEKERLDAEIAKAREMQNKLNIINKKTRQSAFVKMLTMFVAVGLLIFTIISSLQTSSYYLFYSIIDAVSFVIIITILSLDTLFEWDKDHEIAKSTIRLDIQNEDIISLQGKYRELDRKYNEILKEQQKTDDYLLSLQKGLKDKKAEKKDRV